MKVHRYKSNKVICGCDEAGRGSLAGPVVAGAVILPNDFCHPKLNDSKKINVIDRNILENIIKKKSIAWSVGIIHANEIDQINILNASIKAMHIAIKNIYLKLKPELLLIDGNKFLQFHDINHKCIIKGDEKYTSIAAASIIAKTHRDKLMIKYGEYYPNYNWHKNKGYPTKEHKLKILKHGVNKYHRKSFKLS